MAGPKLPRNERLQNDKGQVDQRFLRYWDQIKTRAYDALPGFAKLTASSDVDVNADYLVMRDTSEGVDVKVLAGAIASGPPDATLIETVSLTTGASQDSATIDVSALKAAGYRNLVVRLNGVSVSAGTVIRVQVSADDGTTWTTSAGTVTGGAVTRSSVTLGIMSQILGIALRVDASLDNDGSVTIMDFTQSNTGVPKTFIGSTVWGLNADFHCSGHISGIGAINKLRFETPSGTFDGTGSAEIYAV